MNLDLTLHQMRHIRMLCLDKVQHDSKLNLFSYESFLLGNQMTYLLNTYHLEEFEYIVITPNKDVLYESLNNLEGHVFIGEIEENKITYPFNVLN